MKMVRSLDSTDAKEKMLNRMHKRLQRLYKKQATQKPELFFFSFFIFKLFFFCSVAASQIIFLLLL